MSDNRDEVTAEVLAEMARIVTLRERNARAAHIYGAENRIEAARAYAAVLAADNPKAAS